MAANVTLATYSCRTDFRPEYSFLLMPLLIQYPIIVTCGHSGCCLDTMTCLRAPQWSLMRKTSAHFNLCGKGFQLVILLSGKTFSLPTKMELNSCCVYCRSNTCLCSVPTLVCGHVNCAHISNIMCSSHHSHFCLTH